jgi:hypothetical protein
VRLKGRLVRGVQVPLRHTLSGRKLKVIAPPPQGGGVRSNWR